MPGPTHSSADPPAQAWPTDALDVVRDAVYQCSHPSGVIVAWNAAAESLYGHSRNQAIGQVAADLLATQLPYARAVIERQVEQLGSWQGEVVHHGRDGTPLPVDSRWRLQRGGQDGSTSVLIVD